MEGKKSTITQYHLIAGILFSVLAFVQLVNLVRFLSILSLSSLFPLAILLTLLTLVGYCGVAVLLFMKRKDIIGCAGFGVLALVEFITFLTPYANKFFVLLDLAVYVAMLLVALAFFTNYLPQLKDIAKKIWFVPAIVKGVVSLLTCFTALGSVTNFFFGIVEALAILVSCLYIVYPDGLPNVQGLNTGAGQTSQASYTGSINFNDAYCDMAKHVLLLFFTFGIWYLIWIYKVTEQLNVVKDEEQRNPTTKLLLCMFVPFYGIYWTYKSALRIDKLAREKGISSDITTLCLVTAIFIPIVPPILMQDKLNNIVTAKSSTAKQQPEINIGVANELKSYKELLDSGVITEEEFQKKKNQLLNL